eukprot:scaffold42751_cov59-Phaeocystis_antarctica.AAC.1
MHDRWESRSLFAVRPLSPQSSVPQALHVTKQSPEAWQPPPDYKSVGRGEVRAIDDASGWQKLHR